MKSLLLLGLSHKTAPVAVREGFSREDGRRPASSLCEIAEEAVLLSTCNRFEVYLWGARGQEEALAWLAARGGMEPAALRPHLYVREGRNACKHLFFVAASLDSLVIGETQIRAQVKGAYEAAQQAGTIGPALHPIFRSALRVGKEIAERTGVARGNVSVAGAAADLAERVFGDLAGACVLVLGAGETAELILTHLAARGVRRPLVANRTREHAVDLAGRFGGEALDLAALAEHLPAADVALCAAGGEGGLLGVETVRAALRRRKGRPMVLLDVSVPRGIDPAVGELDNVYRYDMDALAAVTQDALRHRRQDFLQCCTLVDAATLRLEADRRAQEAGPAIAELERRYMEAAQRELEETLRRPGLAEVPREEVERMVHRIVRKLLHLPVRALRAREPEESRLARRLFLSADDEDLS